MSRILPFSWQDGPKDQVVALYNHVEPVIVTPLKYSKQTRFYILACTNSVNTQATYRRRHKHGWTLSLVIL
jgi:hypothetical protein